MINSSVVRFFSQALSSNGMNLMSYLAREGKHAAVDKLIDEGGKLEDAIYGYAMTGNETHIASIFARVDVNDSSKVLKCMGQLIRGYARAGYFDKIHALKNFNDYLQDLMVGVAQSGDRVRVTAMLDKDISLFSSAVEGYASANQGALLTKLIRGTTFYPDAIYHAAHAGHVALVNDLLCQCGLNVSHSIDFSLIEGAQSMPFVDINLYSYLNHAVRGYMAGLHFDEAIRLLTRGASIEQCIDQLKDNNGLPSKGLYLAFLAHVHESKLRANVLKIMKEHGHAIALLEITEEDAHELDLIIEHMIRDDINFFEAQQTFLESSSRDLIHDELSFSYFAKAL